MAKQHFQFVTWIAILLVLSSCSKVQKAVDVITNPSAREVYQRDFDDRPDLYTRWEDRREVGLSDSILISLPYTETGKFFPGEYPVYSYAFELNRGQIFHAKVLTDTSHLVFLDLYRVVEDSTRTFEHVESAGYRDFSLTREIETSGVYKLIIQPEIGSDATFQIMMQNVPAYHFPVVGKGNRAVGSFWGASRGSGTRSHEGIDIFAPRGTPVVAATTGRVTNVGNRGLGGKQVWLRDGKRNLSLYYAHLDSIAATTGQKVSIGDTLGYVGNTGNAKTTAPHLHFGMYQGFRGAINPLYYVLKMNAPELNELHTEDTLSNLLVSRSRSNLRSDARLGSTIVSHANPSDTLKYLGKSGNWFHVRRDESAYFIHQSLVERLD